MDFLLGSAPDQITTETTKPDKPAGLPSTMSNDTNRTEGLPGAIVSERDKVS